MCAVELSSRCRKVESSADRRSGFGIYLDCPCWRAPRQRLPRQRERLCARLHERIRLRVADADRLPRSTGAVAFPSVQGADQGYVAEDKRHKDYDQDGCDLHALKGLAERVAAAGPARATRSAELGPQSRPALANWPML